MIKRTISGMIGAGSLAHNRRDFVAENVDPDRVQLNICYKNENLKEVYKELFDDAVERYNVGKRKDRQIANYYEKIRQGKQEKLFHEVIFQIGNREDMAVGTSEGNLAVKILDEYVKDFQKRNPTLRVFSCYLHQDEATPHLHIDFVPYVTNWKGKGMDTRVSLKQALKSLGFQGGNKHDTELNQWINHEKEVLAEIAKQYGIEWEQKGTHEEHLDVYNFKKKERKKEVAELEVQKARLEEKNAILEERKVVMEEINERMLDQLDELEKDICKVQDNLDKTEKEAEKSKKQAEKYEKQLKRIAPLADNIRRYAGEFSKPIDEVLPEADFLESAKTYREKKAKPVIGKLKELLYSLYLAYIKIREEVDRVQYKYNRLESSNKMLAMRNQEQIEVIDSLKEENQDYYRLKRAVGENKADMLVQAERNREIEEYEIRKALKKRYDKGAR